ncbi:MAG: RNA polymerase sigma factor [Clostridia bacterium]
MYIDKIRKKVEISVTDDLMQKIASGEEKSFEILYNITNKIIYAYILSIVKNSHLAEDIMQDTYISIRKNISKYSSMQKPMAWIFTIAKNHIYTHFRNEKEYLEYDDKNLHNVINLSIENRSIENIVLQTAMKKLNEEERIIVILNAVSGYKFREIAEYLQMSLGTVLSKYHRGIIKLKKSLKEEVE